MAQHSGKAKIIGTLQQIIREPPSLMLWSDETIRLFHKLSAVDVVYIDATGSIIKGMGGVFYLYEIVMRHPLPGKPPIAVGSYLSAKHNIAAITSFLLLFRSDERLVFGPKLSAKLFICDGSVALLKSILLAFMEESVSFYMTRCFAVVTGNATDYDLSQPFVRLCASHTMKNFKSLCSKNKGRFEELMYIFGVLVRATTLEEIETMVFHITILLSTRNEHLASKSFQFFRIAWEPKSGPDIEFDTCAPRDFSSFRSTLDGNNPFMKRLNEVVSSATAFANSATPQGTNKFYNSDIFDSFTKYHVPKLPLFTDLLTGNLSRFGSTSPYEKYDKFFSKLSGSKFQNITKRNRTQGYVEKNQQELKRTRLINRRFTRLDEFAVVYEEMHDGLLREFSDGIRSTPSSKKISCNEREIWKKRQRHVLPEKNVGKYFQPSAKKLKGVSRKTDEDVIVASYSRPEPLVARFKSCREMLSFSLPLSSADLLSRPTAWLDDLVIDHFHALMKTQFTRIDGLQMVSGYSVRSGPHYTPSDKFVQILHVNGNHWITASNIFCDDGEIVIYDSSLCASTYFNDSDAVSSISRLCRPNGREIIIHFSDVQQQSLSGNCGPFAIAYAICLCRGEKPEDHHFDEDELRKKLKGMILEKYLSIPCSNSPRLGYSQPIIKTFTNYTCIH